MGEITKVTKATSKSNSLRTTIPIGIVKHLGLKEGDELEWTINAKGNDLIIIVKSLKKK